MKLRKENMEKKKVLFGAGFYGKLALRKYGKENIAFFVDNNESLWGGEYEGIRILAPTEIEVYKSEYDIVITTRFKEQIIEQLLNMGIGQYSVFYIEDKRLYPTDELIVNPYEPIKGGMLDDTAQAISQKISDIEIEVNRLRQKNNLFNHIEIETVNRCNGGCSFCPVSRGNDIREFAYMTDQLFESIINQLSNMCYAGRVLLFSNNEPFLDDKIIERHKYARERLKNATMHLYTNGTLLTLKKFIDIVQYVDELIIDNYSQDLQLIKPCRTIVEYCQEHSELIKKVTIVLRKPNEILTSRGGDAPNRQKSLASYPKAKCVLPYKQLIVRPDGKVSLCCNDPLGKNTLADLTKETIIEAWNNRQFREVREKLYKGRGNLEHCIYCDFFSVG